MSERNYDIGTKCSICSLPFPEKEEGLVKEVAGIPVNLCGKCWGGMQAEVEKTEAHIYIDCPHCNEQIGLRVETIIEP